MDFETPLTPRAAYNGHFGADCGLTECLKGPSFSCQGTSIFMAQKPQRPDSETSESESKISQRGVSQAVVELVQMERGGLVFWARQRFEIGSELQVRMLRANVPAEAAQGDLGDDVTWASIRGFVVACRGQRRTDGSFGFRVSLLLDPMMDVSAHLCEQVGGPFPVLSTQGDFGKVFGLN